MAKHNVILLALLFIDYDTGDAGLEEGNGER